VLRVAVSRTIALTAARDLEKARKPLVVFVPVYIRNGHPGVPVSSIAAQINFLVHRTMKQRIVCLRDDSHVVFGKKKSLMKTEVCCHYATAHSLVCKVQGEVFAIFTQSP
jgi:hypothetical protein